MRRRQQIAVLGALLAAVWDCRAVDVSGTLEAKFQVDNRFNQSPAVVGELWGDGEILSAARGWRAHFSWSGRLSSRGGDDGGKLYQAFVEKRWPFLGSALRLGRFQRTDVAGFYVLDGGQMDYRLKGWQVQWYGGRPVRMDHVRSIDGDVVYGVRVARRQLLNRKIGSLTLQDYEIGVGFQSFHAQGVSRRLHGNAAIQGIWADRPWRGTLAATYRFDRQRFENVWFDGFVDLPWHLRFRTNYEYYHPRSPFPTFRERFVSAYALGEQSLFRAELHQRPTANWHYFIGGQRATKADGFDGYGLRAGGDYRIGDTTVAATYDYLRIGYDQAHSAYGQVRHAFNSRLEGWVNAALRREEKRLYGINWSRGGEGGVRYLLDSNLVLRLSLSYIANSRRRDDYVGAVRLIYYFDRFRPKADVCALFC